MENQSSNKTRLGDLFGTGLNIRQPIRTRIMQLNNGGMSLVMRDEFLMNQIKKMKISILQFI